MESASIVAHRLGGPPPSRGGLALGLLSVVALGVSKARTFPSS